MTRAVLTFHSIDDSGSVISYPVQAFRQLIEKLSASGVPIVSFGQLLRIPHGVTITFDDGMQSLHRNALPVLRAHGCPAHLFLTTGAVGKGERWRMGSHQFEMLDWSELEQCARGNVFIECHTSSHPDLRKLSAEEIQDECRGADDEIESRLGRRPSYFAFPYGHHDDSVVRAVRGMYDACFTTRLAYLGSGTDLAMTPRLDSYYLKPSVLRDHPLGLLTRSYLTARSLARSVLGRQ